MKDGIKKNHHQNSREEFEIHKQFKGEYSKLAQVSRNSLVFVEYFQNVINEDIEKVKNNKTPHSIEDMNRLITCIQRTQRLAEQANATLTNLENPLISLLE